MDSVELVKRAIKFGGPRRIPLDFLTCGHSDFCHLGVAKPPPIEASETGVTTDEWGCVWKTIDASMGTVVDSPIKKWSDMDNYQFPDILNLERYERNEEVLRQNSKKYVIGGDPLMGIWERAKALRGRDNFLIDLYTEPENSIELLDILTTLEIEVVKRWSQSGVEGFMTWDDWGTERSSWISPTKWREVFKPRYRRIIDTAHSLNMHYFLHSCGYFLNIIPDLIEIGVDVLQLDQPELLGINRLGKTFGGKICFFCSVDIQKSLQMENSERIKEIAKQMIKELGSFNGGFMAKEYPQLEAVNISQEKVEITYEIFEQYGKYPLVM